MDYCQFHLSTLVTKYCPLCNLFLCDFCQHPHAPSPYSTLLKDKIAQILSILKVCLQTQLLRINELKSQDELIRCPDLLSDPIVLSLYRKMKEEDRKWFESVDWRLMKREFPIRGAVARLMGYGLVGGDEVTIQREVRRGVDGLYQAHLALREGVYKQMGVRAKKAIQQQEISITESGQILMPVVPQPCPPPAAIKPNQGNSSIPAMLIDLKVAIRQCNHSKALNLITELQLTHQSPLLPSIKSKLLFHLNLHPQSLTLYHSLPNLTPRQTLQLAILQLSCGNTQKSKKLCQSLLQSSPNNPEYNMLMGDIYFKGARYDEARQYYEKSEKFQRGARVLGRLVSTMVARGEDAGGREQGAIAMINQAIRMEPRNNLFYAVKGRLLAMKKPKEAEQEYKRSLEIAKHPIVENNLGICLYWNAKNNQCAEIFRDLITRTKEVKIIKNYLELLFRNSPKETVKEELRKFRAVYGTNQEYLEYDARLTFQLNDASDSVQVLNLIAKALKENYQNTTLLLFYCKLSAKVGDSNSRNYSITRLTDYLRQCRYLSHFQKADITNTIGFLQHRLGNIPLALQKFKQNSTRTQHPYIFNLAYETAKVDPNQSLSIMNKLVARTDGVYKYLVFRLKLLCVLGRRVEALNALKMLRERFELEEAVVREMERGITGNVGK